MRKMWILAALAFVIPACENMPAPVGKSFSTSQLPILNGKKVTGKEYLGVVALTRYGSAFCTGTLIAQNYVLTAGHCVSYCVGDEDNVETWRPYMKVMVGQSDNDPVKTYEIESFHTHPDFVCTKEDMANDIAILKLKKSVPSTVAKPILPMPPQLDMTTSEVDSKSGVIVTTVGFGMTDPYDDYSSGTKYKTDLKVYAWCPTKGKQSRKCGMNGYVVSDGFIYFDATDTGTCHGDSGGPSLMTRDGSEYIVGITSFGFKDCADFSATTLVSEHYSFITGITGELGSQKPEDCTNGFDDNGDGLVDCKDPNCFSKSYCIPEDCTNGEDDNGDGLVDCKDPKCVNETVCGPEICYNQIDDNGDGRIDCDDPQCADYISCHAEICDNQIDDNLNGYMDCEDPQCSSLLICQPEICDDYVDNNGNGLVDCDDSQCASYITCQQEICNDGIDNNGDGRIDCNDKQCANALSCRPEICDDFIDNNGNGLIDCSDPHCFFYPVCQPEICDDDIDNNADGIIDCDDPKCADSCAEEVSNGSCTAAPLRRPALPALFALIALVAFRISRKRLGF